MFLYYVESGKLEAFDSDNNQLTKLQRLFWDFQDIFMIPNTLPSQREHDHRIPLLLATKPSNIRPYHYGTLQKTEIEKAVHELLQVGFIRPSHNPFSSLVLLLRKKKGTWRLCIDYMELNSIAINDMYLIPLINNLLDMLFGSKYFSKLDLRSGYHLIRRNSSDVEKTTFRTHEATTSS